MKHVVILLLSGLLLGLFFYFQASERNANISRLHFRASAENKGFNTLYSRNQVNTDQTSSVDQIRLSHIDQILSQMTVEQKIGQLIIGGFGNTILDNELRKLVIEYNIGGFNLLERNIQDKKQLQKLNTDIQGLAKEHDLPSLFLAVDQEGGLISRIKFLKELTPQAEIKTSEQAEAVARRRGGELKELGFNMIFSPILDYVTDPKSYLYPRSFHVKPDAIVKLSSSMLEGYDAGGIISVPKHFPGYGNVKPDPHKKEVSYDNIDIFENSLNIFKEVISLANPQAIMTAHIKVKEIDTKPATISTVFLKNLLRENLGYKELIVSDELSMVSALENPSAGGSMEEVAVESLMAGHDMLIISLKPEKISSVIAAIKKAFHDGTISEEQLDKSVKKVITLKLNYL